MAFNRSFTDPGLAPTGRGFRSTRHRCVCWARPIYGRNSVAVSGEDFRARHVLVASGARPAPLYIPSEKYVITSEQFLDLGALASHIVLIGGGYIAAEFSHIAARGGTRVTMLQRADRMLTGFDPDLASWLMEKFGEWGIEVRTRSTVHKVEKTGTAFAVHGLADAGPRIVASDRG